MGASTGVSIDDESRLASSSTGRYLKIDVETMKATMKKEVNLMPSEAASEAKGCLLDESIKKITIDFYPWKEKDSDVNPAAGNIVTRATRILYELKNHPFSWVKGKDTKSLIKQFDEYCQNEKTKGSCHPSTTTTTSMTLKFASDIKIDLPEGQIVPESDASYRLVLDASKHPSLSGKKVSDLAFFDFIWKLKYKMPQSQAGDVSDIMSLPSLLTSREDTPDDFKDDIVVGDYQAKYPMMNHISIRINDSKYHFWHRPVGKLWYNRTYFSLADEEKAKKAIATGEIARGLYTYSKAMLEAKSGSSLDTETSPVFTHRFADFHFKISPTYDIYKKTCKK
ncbi:MAG: hypothetical protein OXC44_07745 [Proteobacteria bacterium]|nr:hypothetical protein [Pseudomonadota bacterium]